MTKKTGRWTKSRRYNTTVHRADSAYRRFAPGELVVWLYQGMLDVGVVIRQSFNCECAEARAGECLRHDRYEIEVLSDEDHDPKDGAEVADVMWFDLYRMPEHRVALKRDLMQGLQRHDISLEFMDRPSDVTKWVRTFDDHAAVAHHKAQLAMQSVPPSSRTH